MRYPKNRKKRETRMCDMNFKEKACRICGGSFKPTGPQVKTCSSCLDVSCHVCGGSVTAKSIRLARYKPTCKKCRDVGSPLWSRRMSRGYVEIKTTDGWMLEHRYVVESSLGRKLLKTEIVHHIDENPSNNDQSNLVVCQSLREHLDTYHKHALKTPHPHRNGRRRKDGTLAPMREYRLRRLGGMTKSECQNSTRKAAAEANDDTA